MRDSPYAYSIPPAPRLTRGGRTAPPTELDPSTWGHLDIPEFQDLVVPVAVLLRRAEIDRSRSQRDASAREYPAAGVLDALGIETATSY